MLTDQLIPPVEKRISAWVSLQEIKKKVTLQRKPPTITISREFGCEGYPLAEALKSKLDNKGSHEWTIFDDAIITKIQKDTTLNRHLFKSYGERSKFLDDLVDMISPSWQSEEDAFRLMTKTIYSIAMEGHAIIVGRGAFAITKDLPNCYHIRLKAPLTYRAKSLAKRLGISEDEALMVAEEKEQQRTIFLKRYLNTAFSLDHFHVVFDNSKSSVNQIADTFVTFIGEIE